MSAQFMIKGQLTMTKSFDDGTSRTDWDETSIETVLDEGNHKVIVQR